MQALHRFFQCRVEGTADRTLSLVHRHTKNSHVIDLVQIGMFRNIYVTVNAKKKNLLKIIEHINKILGVIINY